jgi:hypothetical protein
MRSEKEVEMITEVEKARQLLKSLEIRNSKSRVENALRVLCIQELLEDLRRNKICEIENY